MQLFYAPDIVPPEYTLGEEEARHCAKVLRLSAGDSLHLTDGRGTLYRAVITECSPRRCAVRVEQRLYPFEPLPYNLTMAVAPTKNIDRFEWFVEKATEIGVSKIIALECAHSERRNIKVERESKVAAAAMKQSLKAFLPEVTDMTPFGEVVSMPFEGRRFIAHCNAPRGEKHYLASTLARGENALILIGPEGDFSPEETECAVAAGFEEISLGTCRLRTETAAVAAVAMVSVVNNM